MSHQLALDEIEKFVKVFKAFEEAKNAITSLASLEQNVKELTIAKNKATADLEEEKTKLDSFRKLVLEDKNKILAKYKSDVESAKTKTTSLIEKANEIFLKDKEDKETELALLSANIIKEKVVYLNLSKDIKSKQQSLNELTTTQEEMRKQINLLYKNI